MSAIIYLDAPIYIYICIYGAPRCIFVADRKTRAAANGGAPRKIHPVYVQLYGVSYRETLA